MDPEAIGPLLLDIRAAGPTEEEGPDMSDKESVLEGIQKVIDMVSALCAGKQTPEQIDKIAASIAAVGFTSPILCSTPFGITAVLTAPVST